MPLMEFASQNAARQYEFERVRNAVQQRYIKQFSSHINLIHGVIGHGEHSTVYSAELSGSKKLVVVKEDHRDFTKNLPALTNKIDNLQRINHRYISGFYDYFTEENTRHTFFILEHIPGESVQRRLNHLGLDDSGKVMDWACQIFDALAYLH